LYRASTYVHGAGEGDGDGDGAVCCVGKLDGCACGELDGVIADAGHHANVVIFDLPEQTPVPAEGLTQKLSSPHHVKRLPTHAAHDDSAAAEQSADTSMFVIGMSHDAAHVLVSQQYLSRADPLATHVLHAERVARARLVIGAPAALAPT